MKKNILTVVIMATSVINLVLTIVLIFSVMPAMNKTSNLIDKVASVIDLEIENPDQDNSYSMEDLDPFTISYEAKETLNLQKDEGDDAAHYFQLGGLVISFNMLAEDYDSISEQVKTNSVYAEDAIKSTISSYSKANFDQAKIRTECVKKLQEMYNTKCIVDVTFISPLLS